MLRKTSLYCAALALVLAGCDKPDGKDKNIVHMNMPTVTNAVPQQEKFYAPPPPFVPPPDVIIQTNAPNALFSLQHDLTLSMPRDAVAVRFQRARDVCLKDKTLHCTLTSASLTANRQVTAQLQVALPHDAVAVYEKRMLKALPQDGSGKVEITSRSSTIENQTQSSADIERQLAQAIAYRDSLETLAKRSNLTVEEIIKIHTELSQAQSAVDNALASKRASNSNIVLERMTISLEEAVVPVQTSAFAGFWKNAGDIFMVSTAAMLFRIVNALPWLPLAGLLAWLVARLVRRVQIRRNRPDPT